MRKRRNGQDHSPEPSSLVLLPMDTFIYLILTAYLRGKYHSYPQLTGRQLRLGVAITKLAVLVIYQPRGLPGRWVQPSTPWEWGWPDIECVCKTEGIENWDSLGNVLFVNTDFFEPGKEMYRFWNPEWTVSLAATLATTRGHNPVYCGSVPCRVLSCVHSPLRSLSLCQDPFYRVRLVLQHSLMGTVPLRISLAQFLSIYSTHLGQNVA